MTLSPGRARRAPRGRDTGPKTDPAGEVGRDARPGLDAMMKAVSRREVDLVMAWSVDRLGRSLTGLLELLGARQAR
jgi:DNA invertase Pin-like site-specific DNA recombinase